MCRNAGWHILKLCLGRLLADSFWSLKQTFRSSAKINSVQAVKSEIPDSVILNKFWKKKKKMALRPFLYK